MSMNAFRPDNDMKHSSRIKLLFAALILLYQVTVPAVAQKTYDNPDLTIADKKEILKMYGGDKHEVTKKDVYRVEKPKHFTIGEYDMTDMVMEARVEQLNRWRKEIAAEEAAREVSAQTVAAGQAAIVSAQSNSAAIQSVAAEDFDFYHNDRISHVNEAAPMEKLDIQGLFDESVSRFEEKSPEPKKEDEPRKRTPKECYEAFIGGEDLSDEEMGLANEYNMSLPEVISVDSRYVESGEAKDQTGSYFGDLDIYSFLSPGAEESLLDSSYTLTEPLRIPNSSEGSHLCTLPEQGLYLLENNKLTPFQSHGDRQAFSLPDGIQQVLSNGHRAVLVSDSSVWDFSSFEARKLKIKPNRKGKLHLSGDGRIFQSLGQEISDISCWVDSLQVFVHCYDFPGEVSNFTITGDGIPVVLSLGKVYVHDGAQWIVWYEDENAPVQDIISIGNNLCIADNSWVVFVLGDYAGELLSQQGGTSLLYDGNSLFLLNNNTVYPII